MFTVYETTRNVVGMRVVNALPSHDGNSPQLFVSDGLRRCRQNSSERIRAYTSRQATMRLRTPSLHVEEHCKHKNSSVLVLLTPKSYVAPRTNNPFARRTAIILHVVIIVVHLLPSIARHWSHPVGGQLIMCALQYIGVDS